MSFRVGYPHLFLESQANSDSTVIKQGEGLLRRITILCPPTAEQERSEVVFRDGLVNMFTLSIGQYDQAVCLDIEVNFSNTLDILWSTTSNARILVTYY